MSEAGPAWPRGCGDVDGDETRWDPRVSWWQGRGDGRGLAKRRWDRYGKRAIQTEYTIENRRSENRQGDSVHSRRYH